MSRWEYYGPPIGWVEMDDDQPPLDRQSQAYQGATDVDHVPDRDISAWIEAVHQPISDPAEVPSVEQLEEHWWDIGREGPKTVAEARAALATRIADPTAPDDGSVADAYDQLDNGG